MMATWGALHQLLMQQAWWCNATLGGTPLHRLFHTSPLGKLVLRDKPIADGMRHVVLARRPLIGLWRCTRLPWLFTLQVGTLRVIVQQWGCG